MNYPRSRRRNPTTPAVTSPAATSVNHSIGPRVLARQLWHMLERRGVQHRLVQLQHRAEQAEQEERGGDRPRSNGVGGKEPEQHHGHAADDEHGGDLRQTGQQHVGRLCPDVTHPHAVRESHTETRRQQQRGPTREDEHEMTGDPPQAGHTGGQQRLGP